MAAPLYGVITNVITWEVFRKQQDSWTNHVNGLLWLDNLKGKSRFGRDREGCLWIIGDPEAIQMDSE
jgi:hypothetical protein